MDAAPCDAVPGDVRARAGPQPPAWASPRPPPPAGRGFPGSLLQRRSVGAKGDAEPVDRDALEHGPRAWPTQLKGVRAVNLYSADHSQVLLVAETLAALVEEALGWCDSLAFHVQEDGVDLDGVRVYTSADERETLIERLYADGVRSLQFHAVPDLESGHRLFAILAPYCHAERAPLRSVAEALRWEPFAGVTVGTWGAADGPGGLEDALANRERAWHAQLLATRARLADPLDPDALLAVWDGTGGIIPWPPPMRDAESRVLVDEVEAANASGAPLGRIGQLLVRSVALWADDPRVAELLTPLPARVEDCLERNRPGDVARLLQPLLLWATEPTDGTRATPVRDRVGGLVGVLLSDRTLGRLLEAARAGTIEPVELAAYFGALPPEALPDVVVFLAELPDGPWRAAMVQVGRKLAREEGALLHTTVAAGPLGPALAALEVVDQQPPTRIGVQLALEALTRSEGALRLRGLRMLLPHPSRTVAEAVLPLVSDSQREVRSLALAWMARYEHRPAFEPLVDLTRGARFPQLPLPERLEIGRTLGVVGGRDALELVRDNLGDRWHRADPAKSAPWLVCLAATGLEEAGDYLQTLCDSAPAHLLPIANDALALWHRRRADLAEGPAPPVRTAPGAPVPTRHSSPGQAGTPGPRRVVSRPAWKGPLPQARRVDPPPRRPASPGDAPPWQDEE